LTQTMSSLATSLLAFLSITCGALLGMFLSPKLPVQHQTSESKDGIRLGMGLVATTVAVALGLLISSAKNFYDTQNTEITQLAANYILLDQTLSYYGTEATDIRSAMHRNLAHLLESEGSSRGTGQSYFFIRSGARVAENPFPMLLELNPKNENQRALKAQALSVAFQLGQTRWLIFEQNAVPLPSLLLAMLIGWLVVLFMSFGMFSPRNITVLAGLFLAALAVSGAILLILEMYRPEVGLIRVSDAPLRAALAQVGQ
jgi:hypothetical protein